MDTGDLSGARTCQVSTVCLRYAEVEMGKKAGEQDEDVGKVQDLEHLRETWLREVDNIS